MHTTVLEQSLSTEQLYEEISSFVLNHNMAYLGTMGLSGLRVSPVKYFADQELNVYIHSKGGSKFTNIVSNSHVCLLICTDFFEDYHKIQGVQLFGKAEILEPYTSQYALASQLCPWPHSGDAKIIQIYCESAVYVDRINRRDLKQEWLRRS